METHGTLSLSENGENILVLELPMEIPNAPDELIFTMLLGMKLKRDGKVVGNIISAERNPERSSWVTSIHITDESFIKEVEDFINGKINAPWHLG